MKSCLLYQLGCMNSKRMFFFFITANMHTAMSHYSTHTSVTSVDVLYGKYTT